MIRPESVSLIETYLAKLRLELDSAGAADVDDIVAEVRSLLVDAAGDDLGLAEAEIGRLGTPADLAAGVLAEHGLDSSAGVPTADWWRMGAAAPIDIVVGVSVPLAILVPLYRAVVSVQGPLSEGAALPALLAGGALLAGSLYWPWWVWRPWREGGLRTSAGMAITGISVARAPGFRRVVRTKDLAALGLRSAGRRPLVGWATFIGALVLLTFAFVAGPGLDWGAPAPAAPRAASRSDIAASIADQDTLLQAAVTTFYEDLLAGRGDAASRSVADSALSDFRGLSDRARAEKVGSFSIESASETAPGVWDVLVDETSPAGTRRVRLTLNLRVTLFAGTQRGDFLITGIREE